MKKIFIGLFLGLFIWGGFFAYAGAQEAQEYQRCSSNIILNPAGESYPCFFEANGKTKVFYSAAEVTMTPTNNEANACAPSEYLFDNDSGGLLPCKLDNGETCATAQCVKAYEDSTVPPGSTDSSNPNSSSNSSNSNSSSSSAGSCTAGANGKDFAYLVCLVIKQVIKPITGVVVALAFLYFLWGIAKYLTSTGNEKSRDEARSAMIYGIIGLTVMFSVWGLVTLLQNSFELTGGTQPPIPKINP